MSTEVHHGKGLGSQGFTGFGGFMAKIAVRLWKLSGMMFIPEPNRDIAFDIGTSKRRTLNKVGS